MEVDSLVIAAIVHFVLVGVHVHDRLRFFGGVATGTGLRGGLNDNLILQSQANTKRKSSKHEKKKTKTR